MTLYEIENLMKVIKEVHSERADDLCWLDIDRIFRAVNLPVPDRRVGDKDAMLKNCSRFIDIMCKDGKWQSYSQLEADRNMKALEIETLKKKIDAMKGEITIALAKIIALDDCFDGELGEKVRGIIAEAIK